MRFFRLRWLDAGGYREGGAADEWRCAARAPPHVRPSLCVVRSSRLAIARQAFAANFLLAADVMDLVSGEIL